MSTEIKIHGAQMSIIRALLFTPEAGFAELQKPTALDSDHFKFHIAKLVELQLVEKITKGRYKLSQKGKEFANKLDTDTNTVERQPKTSVLIVAYRTNPETGLFEQLLQQRLKNPYYGYWMRFGGKVRWGETVTEAAGRELAEETGLSADLTLGGIYHKMDYREETKDMLEDKFFYLIKATNLTGELIETIEGGKNAWLTNDQLTGQDKVMQGIDKTLEQCLKNELEFIEEKVYYQPEDY